MTQQLWSPSIRIIICMFGAEYQEFIRKCVNKVLAVVKWNRILNIDRQSLFHIIINLICDPWYNNDMLKCISLWQENVGLSQIKCLPSEQIDSRFNKRLSILITRFSRFSKINYNSNRNLLRCTNMTFCAAKYITTDWNNTRMLSENGKNITEWTNKQELPCLNTLNFYGSLRLQLCLSRSNIEVNKLRYFVFNWTMNVTPDWLDRAPSTARDPTSQDFVPQRISLLPLLDFYTKLLATFEWWNWNFHTRKPLLGCLSGGKDA